MRKVFIISKYKIISVGLTDIISKTNNISIVSDESYNLLQFTNQNTVVITVIDKNYLEDLEFIYKQKEKQNFKWIILDVINSNAIIDIAMKFGVNGYLLLESDEKTIVNAISNIFKDIDYYDTSLTNRIIEINNNNNKIRLSKREVDVLNSMLKGHSNIQIATNLSITENTVKKHVGKILKKLNAKDRVNAILIAKKNRLSYIKSI